MRAGVWAGIVCLAAWARAGEAPAEDLVHQVAPTAALSAGVLEGETPFRRVLALGDTGLGALSPLDGEIILLEGRAYHADADGRVRVVAPDERTPFMTVKRFAEDRRLVLSSVDSLDEVARRLDTSLSSANRVYALRVDGRFQRLTLRSVPRQKRPFPAIDRVVAAQRVFELQDVTGTLVGFRMPAYLAAVSGSGYHFHFIDTQRRRGGHVLDVSAETLVVSVDRAAGLTLWVPEDKDFLGAPLNADEEGRFQRAVRGEQQ